MKYLYHGTTLGAMHEILKGNYNPEETVWNCSNSGFMYAYELEKWRKAEGYDEDYTTDQAKEVCRERANEAGQIANAILDSPYSLTFVIEFGIPDEIYEKAVKDQYINDDSSTESMKDYGAIEVDSCWLNQHIKNKDFNITVFHYEFFVKLTPFYIVGLFDNQYFQETLEKLPSQFYEALRIMSQNDCYIEEIFYPALLNKIKVNIIKENKEDN